jgi:hypothetical protein
MLARVSDVTLSCIKRGEKAQKPIPKRGGGQRNFSGRS